MTQFIKRRTLSCSDMGLPLGGRHLAEFLARACKEGAELDHTQIHVSAKPTGEITDITATWSARED